MSIAEATKTKDKPCLLAVLTSLIGKPRIDEYTMHIVLGVLGEFAGQRITILKGKKALIRLRAVAKFVPKEMSNTDALVAIQKGLGCSRSTAWRYLKRLRG